MESLVPVFGILAGVVSTGFLVWGFVQVAKGQVGDAVARWIGSQGGQFGNPELASDVAALREQVEHLEQQLVETNERLDFTERLLARGGPSGSPGGD
ncbi:MAG: hypothetical protein ABI765_16150 [Gemmatimonadota bacterium]